MAKGKLSLAEKHKIQVKLSEGKNHADIAKSLGRKETTVSKYINGELADLHADLHSAMFPEPEPEEQEAETKEPNISKSLKNQVISRLVRDNSNLTVNKATSLVNKVCNKVTVKVTNPDLLYNACLQNIGAGDMMATKTIGNNSGVAIMTKSASEKADDAKVKNNFTSRTARGAVFRQEDAL